MMKYLLVSFILLCTSAFADELTIFDVRKNLPMSDTDKVFRDFYINGGNEAGLAVGQIITVERRMPLYDTYLNRSAGDLQLKVAKIKIIHVQKGLAVARLFSEFTRDNAPLLEDNFLMVGDRLNMSTAQSEKDSKKAEADNQQQNEPVAANTTSTEAKIVINSVELSSEAVKPNPPTPDAIEAPILQ